MKRWDLLLFCLIFTAIGAVGGWMGALQSGGEAVDAAAQGHGHSHGAPAAGGGSDTTFTPEALRNLGVTTGRPKKQDFMRTRDVAAVIEYTATNERPVFAPVSGQVTEIHVAPGSVVEAGAPLVTFVRDPIKPPTLTLTGTLLEPAKETIHEAVVELRKTHEELAILETELGRLQAHSGETGGEELPIIPQQRLIDLRYQVLRTKGANERARHELEKHGFTDDQIDGMTSGEYIPTYGLENWKQALIRNGLWPARAEQLLAVMPEAQAGLPWVIATIGELAAAGQIDSDLQEWLRASPAACRAFIDIGALRQRGHSVARIRLLHEIGALEPTVVVRAPGAGEVPDWDVTSLDVKPGARVEAGARLVGLMNPRQVWLRCEPVGSEKPDILRALAEGLPCRARPLVPGAGPMLDEVVIAYATSDPAGGATIARALVANEPLTAPDQNGGARRRSWKLRGGLRYVLQVPTVRMTGVYVLPRDAVTREGVDRVVYVQDGPGFKPIPVVVAYEDQAAVVIPIDAQTKLFPDDVIALSGAYALGLALQAGSQPAAGHGHSH